MSTTQETLKLLNMKALVELYNLMADKPVKKFQDHATAVRRVERQITESAMELFHNEKTGEWDVRAASSEVDETEDAPEPKTKRARKVSDKSPGRKSPLLGQTIVLVRKENPKRKGAANHPRYELYSTVTTTDEYVEQVIARKLGNRREALADLRWDASQDFIRIK